MLVFSLELLNKNSLTILLSLKRALSNRQILSQCFGFQSNKSELYIENNKLQLAKPENLQRNIEYCREIGFKDDTILLNPILLRAKPVTLEQRYLLLKEGGFCRITPKILATFISQVRKSVLHLKYRRLIPNDTDVAESLIKHLNPCPDGFSVNYDEKLQSWSDVYFEVFKKYLKWRLQVNDEDIENLLAVHTSIGHKSLRYLCENITIAENLGFTPDKILKNGYLLRNYPKYTKTVLKDWPTLAGVDMKKAMRMHPKLVMTSPTNIQKIYSILKEFNISDDTIRHTMNVFTLTPETVRHRLLELQSVADLKVLLKNPHSLSLIVHHNRAKSRLFFLKQLHLNCADVVVLGSDGDKFDVHIRQGRDINSLNDTIAFLQSLLQKESKEFKEQLKKHPFFLQVPFVRMEETFYHLKSINFTVEAIFRVIYILLYPKEKIDDALNQISLNKHLKQKSLTQIEMLNLILYFIEREHHFNGNGIWRKSEIVHDIPSDI